MPRKAPTAPRTTIRGTPEPAPVTPQTPPTQQTPQTPQDLDTAYFARLIDERMEHTREQISTLTAVIREVTLAAKDIPADDEHDPEGTTVSVERANEVALLAAAETSLIELMEARERLNTDSYGICERCGTAIPTARLEIRPETRFCVECASVRRR
ncbi:TraR/DksA C4-type zinc finger protein [Arthrobacter sp. zg-Y859]|uniref:TraR/DksA C4-type zinc finger protein n=1 Tax=Arthrobacter jinronghuae TaxID=2964609 RepID=A0ABT1NV39_9MICC|nr:TraR/DksA C4-type zinc finger protein [Arthrobacter jinronghuae]MCQ1951525.1 TraR/DksA C4-type zinc finger protein [Arthrobacter jinronghuae]UWX79603.1 TraR/DksA C4-type zinc finger protein [Arthrobacter jinronghuae]